MARCLGSEAQVVILPNGLAVAYQKVASSVECLGVAIMAGSRDESDGEFGLAHFVEHTIFKGTKRRRSHHVIKRMESIGGELNAYTTKEETFVYTIAPSGNVSRAIELIADLIINASFPEHELAKERDVVADEISSYLDDPDAAVYDDFEDLVFEGSSLGHNILGTKRSVMLLTGNHCRRWLADNYHVGRMAFFYAGPSSLSRIIPMATRYFEGVPTGGKELQRAVPLPVQPFENIKSIKSHQAHTVTGCRLPIIDLRQRFAMSLCNNILGGPGMNSRFNISLREKRGLVYTVESVLSRYTGEYLWSVYFGCDAEHTELCKDLIYDDIEKLAEGGLPKQALKIAKRQFLGQMILSGAAVENMALSLGRATIRGEKYLSFKELEERVGSLTSDDLQSCARLIFDSGLSSLTFK